MSDDRRIAHYNLLEPIGDGGIGEVYRARDTRVGRTVALRVVGPDITADPSRLGQFLQDAHAAAALSHPNIASLWDIGEADGAHYLAYEFASGQRLREDAGGTAMNLRRAIDLAIQVADGVAEGHSQGVIHGDLRPETIVVTPKGSAKILDFGLARWTRGGKIRQQAAQSPDSLPPDAAPLVAYMSPEQALGGGVDARTDVFSLGTLTYELVTGRSPFAATTATDTVVNVIRGSAAPPSQVNPSTPAALDGILARALMPDLARRHQSAAALASDLRAVAATLAPARVDAAQESEVLPLDESPDRSAGALLAGALAAAAAAAVFVWWLLVHR